MAAAAFYLLMVGAALLFRHLWHEPPLPPVSGNEYLLPASAAALLLVIATVASSAAIVRRFEWARRLDAEFRAILGRKTVPSIIVIALASGIGEEVFFRGALQPLSAKWFESETAGWAVTSVLFGAIHFVPKRAFLPWTFFAIGMGFVLGALFWVSGSIVPPIILHVLVNGVNLYRLCGRAGLS